MMMPFMAGQSMLMGDAFGKSYQYGKRKISAMSNEEFNKLTPEMLGKQIVTDYAAIIPSLEEAVRASTAFQSMIIQEMGVILKNIPNEILKFMGLEGFSEEGGTIEGLIQVNALQVASWSDTKLSDEFRNNLEAYTLLSKSVIQTAYNKRITGTEPPPDEHVHEPAHHPIEQTVGWLDTNATGLVQLSSKNDKYALFIKQNGNWVEWFGVSSGVSVEGSLTFSIQNAINAWPGGTYTQFGLTNPIRIYWTLKSKYPNA